MRDPRALAATRARVIRRMFDPVTIDTQVDRLGRVAASMDMIAVKRGHAAATGTASGRASARTGDAVAAYESHQGEP